MTSILPDKQVLHRMGFYSNQEGIALRYIREDKNWKDHLTRTKRFILNAVKKTEPEVITVLGSGWLLDIPLKELIQTGARIKLADVVHPPQVLKSLAGEPMVEFINCDITGGLIALAHELSLAGRRLESEGIPALLGQLNYNPGSEPGMILSVNLLSQLTSLPSEFLQKKKILNPADAGTFTSVVQERHLRFLKKHDSVLISDFAEIHTNRSGEATRSELIHCRLPAGKMRMVWKWEFDTGGFYRQGHRTYMEVVAIHL